jgi:Outer membrane protein beta-barrel domain
MTRKWTPIVVAALLSLVVSQLHAAEGLYLGAGIGQAGIKDNINTENFDADDAAYKVFLGWRFKVLPVFDVAIEGAYTEFGKPSQTLGGQNVETNINGPSIAGLAILPLGPFDLYAKLGGINWNVDTTIGNAKSSRSGSDPFYGLGVGLTLGPLGLRAEYERYQIKDIDRVDLFSLSALIQF